MNGGMGYASSYSFGTHSQTVDLTASVSTTQLDSARAIISFSEWVAGTYARGQYYFTLELLDAAGAVLGTASLGSQASPMFTPDGGAWAWPFVKQTVSYENTGGKAIRKARITVGGRDTVGWGGVYGTNFSAPCLSFALAPK
jgi:hypothetical protein